MRYGSVKHIALYTDAEITAAVISAMFMAEAYFYQQRSVSP